MSKIHFEILDKKRMELLPFFKKFKDRFYLAGGTGLALQLAHRDSIDFDLFTDQEFNSEELLREVKMVFSDYPIELVQAGNMTLNVIIGEDIRASFFCIKDTLLKPLLDFDYFRIASIDDIACMKITALLRAEFKDYVDLYYIFKQLSLKEIMENCREKHKKFEEMVYLKALSSFDDINLTKILFKRGKKIKLAEIKRDFTRRIKGYISYLR